MSEREAKFVMGEDGKLYDHRGREQVKNWYALVVMPGRELKIRDKLVSLAKNPKYENQILTVMVPAITETIESVNKKGDVKIKTKETLVYTQYVYVEMILNDDTYHAVKIDGVRHILGDTEGPTPIREHEIRELFKLTGKEFVSSVTYNKGDEVQIIDKESAFTHQKGIVVEVSPDKDEITIEIEMFGRETKTKVTPAQIRKV